jgi:glyoxylase-like metal-dependent hydrolase (beta-lactamase superfamily II)
MAPFPDTQFAQLRPGLWVWHAYDPSLKTDLFSAAILTRAGIFLVDPIPLAHDDVAALNQAGSIAGIILTNANHQRAALEYSDRFSVPVLGHPDALLSVQPRHSGNLSAIATDLDPIEIEGAVAGELALFHREDGGTLIVGDALINLESYGFTFLPRKYCLDQKQMRRSLKKLLKLTAQRILFAHGAPIISRASERLRQVLDADDSHSR